MSSGAGVPAGPPERLLGHFQSALAIPLRVSATFRAHGAHVVAAARDLTKAEAATARLLKHAEADGGSFQPIALDPKTAEALRKKTEESVRESF